MVLITNLVTGANLNKRSHHWGGPRCTEAILSRMKRQVNSGNFSFRSLAVEKNAGNHADQQSAARPKWWSN